jgi:hypothetical protein
MVGSTWLLPTAADALGEPAIARATALHAGVRVEGVRAEDGDVSLAHDQAAPKEARITQNADARTMFMTFSGEWAHGPRLMMVGSCVVSAAAGLNISGTLQNPSECSEELPQIGTADLVFPHLSRDLPVVGLRPRQVLAEVTEFRMP